MTKIILTTLAFFSLNAFAGGIGFNKPLVGHNPLTGREIRIEVRGGIGGDAPVQFTLNGQEGTMTLVSRNADSDIGETILNLRVANETLRGVLSGDCQIVERMILILPSGAQITLQEQP